MGEIENSSLLFSQLFGMIFLSFLNKNHHFTPLFINFFCGYSTRSRFSFIFSCFSHPLGIVFVCYGATLICLSAIEKYVQEIKSIVINMLQNYNHRYFNHNINIKCIDLIIKCIGLEPIHYVINLYVVSSSMIFNNFNSIFL